MMNRERSRLRWIVLPLILLVVPTAALATNGMYLAGYGSEAAGRAGANIAVADRALGLQANPAGIAQLMGNHYSIDMQILMPDMSFSGPGNPSIDAENRSFFMPSFSYVRGGRDTDWTWGIAMVSQGGMGATFEGYNTPFGTSGDETYSQVRFATITPTVAYSFTDDLSIGLSGNIGWSDVEFRFWPNTSFYTDSGTPMDPADDIGFFGANLAKSASSLSYSFRLGLMWRASNKWQLGLIYQTETESDYDGGILRTNQSAFGLGIVDYDAEVDGFTWPEQYGIGVQFRPADRWVLALDVKQYNWSSAIEQITVRGTNPSSQMTPLTEFPMPFTFNWEDQTIYALGVEARVSEDVTLRWGYNHGDSPVPDATLNPLFPATPEDHATVGVGWNVGSYTLNAAIERAFEKTQTNNNTDPMVNPFGPGATVDHSQWTISLGFSKAFAR